MPQSVLATMLIVNDTEADDGRWRIANLANEGLLAEIIFDKRTSDSESGARHHGFFKVGCFVPDVEEVAKRIEEATGERPHVLDYPENEVRILQIIDPEGNRIQLHSPLAVNAD